jgi:hypothetical protein
MSAELISPTRVKQYLLDTAAKTRHHKFTQVSQETLDKVEAAARSAARTIVASAPSKGKRI